MSIGPNLTTLEIPGTQPLAMLLCVVFWGSNRNHYYLLLVLVMRPLCHVYVHVCIYVYLYRNSKINALVL